MTAAVAYSTPDWTRAFLTSWRSTQRTQTGSRTCSPSSNEASSLPTSLGTSAGLLASLICSPSTLKFDPNGRQCLTMEGYRGIGWMVHFLAARQSRGRLLIVQEGGYHLTYSAYCLHATLEGVLNLPLPLLSDAIAYYPEDEAFAVKVIESIKQYQKGTFPFLKGA